MTGRAGRRLGGREATSARIEGAYALAVGLPDKPAPAGWTWRLLTDLARLESGHTPSRRRAEYWGGDVPWIGIRDATGNHGRTIHQTNEATNELGIANSAARILPANTVCLSRTASVGYVVVMGRPMATSQDFVNWVCGDELDYRFLKYVLLAEGDTLLRFASGSVHQTIYFPEVKAFHISLPPMAEQRAISDALGALDDKIELNRRMNETLEAMAEVIFRDWFVDFGPVRRRLAGETDPVVIMGGLTPDPAHADQLAMLFPAALSDDGLPEGWLMTTLAEYADLNPESWNPRTAPAAIRYVDLSNTKWGEIENVASFRWAEAPSRARRVARRGDTLVGTVRPGNGSYTYVGVDGLTASTGFAQLRPKAIHLADLVYIASTNRENIERLSLLADGGAYPAVNPSVVLDMPFPAIPAGLAIAFAVFSSPIRALIEEHKSENRTLAETRDYLLSRLMSGAVRVGAHHADLEDVA